MANHWGPLGKFIMCYQGNYFFCSEILLITLEMYNVLETELNWHPLFSGNNLFQNNNGLID